MQVIVILRWFFYQALLIAKIVAGTVAIVLAVVAVLVAMPRAIDWQDLKPKLGLALTSATGRTVSLDGPLSVEFLPWPALWVGDVRIANAPGAATQSMLKVRRLSIRLSLKALMRGRIEISSIVLDEPLLAIEPDADGRPNWWLPALESGSGAEAAGLPVTLDTVEIRNGRLLHAIGLVDQPLEAHAVDFVATIDPRRERVKLQGTAIINGLPTRISIGIRTESASGPPVTLHADLPGGHLAFEGWTGHRSTDDPLHGSMSATSTSPATFIASLAQMMGRPPIALDELPIRRVEASGDVTHDGQRFSIKGLTLEIDGVQVSGSLDISAGDTVELSGRLSVPRLDADHWITHLRDHPLALPAEALPGGATAMPLPRADLVVQVGETLYRQDTIRNLVVAFKFDGEGFHVREVIAVLPGDCRLYYRVDQGSQVLANHPDMVEIHANRLRDTLRWIGIDTAAVPADRLQQLRLEGRTRVFDGAIQVSDATFTLDDQSGTGTARASLAIPTTISARFDLPRFDLDSYRLTEPALQKMVPPPTKRPDNQADAIGPPVIDISLKVGQVTYRGEPVHDVDAQVVIQGNRLALERVGVGNLFGARLEISGSVDDFATSPRFELGWRGVLPDVDRVLDYAGLPRFARGRIGTGQTSGRAIGTLGEVELPAFSVDMLDAKISAEGHVSFGEELRFDFPRWSLVTTDIGVIAAVASGTVHRPVGALNATGSFRGDAQRAAFQGDITLDGMKLSGTLASTLAPHPMVSIALQAQQTLRLDRWLPEPPLSSAAHSLRGRTARAASAGEPAWLAALRSLNGDLSLAAPALAWGPYEMTGFALSARLKDGQLAVERFAGSLGGATVQLSGSVDAQQVPAALSVDGELLDIDVSRVIAVAHTKNDFGTDDLAVALHGKISLAGMALRARGTTLDDALQSLSGKARTTGEIRPVITRGSLSLASLATGIGSLFSSEMGFASAIIENFIDRQVSPRGALEVGDGIVYLRDYLLEGEKAKAVIHGHVDPLNKAIDTRIELNNKDGSIDYSMSLRGPLHAPTLQSEPLRGR